jgi:hypothetical protein
VRAKALLLIGLALCLLLSQGASAELTQQGKLIVGFDGGLAPKRLPRDKPAPVAVKVEGNVKTTKGAPLPQLRTITVAINRAGRLYDKGLPTCNVKAIQPATEAEAQTLCHRSIVGTGHVSLQAHIEGQHSFPVEGKLLAFNGPRKNGRKIVLAQVYSEDPPGAFVLTFTLKKQPGLFGTVMSTTLPKEAEGWAYLTHFDMTLDRSYRHKGVVHSYVSAACSAPAGFPGAVFPFAKAAFGFAGGQRLAITVVRSCLVG